MGTKGEKKKGLEAGRGRRGVGIKERIGENAKVFFLSSLSS